MTNKITSRLAVVSVATLFSVSATAQDTNSPPASIAQPLLQKLPASGVQASLNFSYDASSKAKFQGTRLGDSDATALNLAVNTQIALDKKWFIPLGLQSDNYFLGTVSGAPIPDNIHTLRFNTGLGWHFNDQWTFTALLSPSLYRFEDVGGSDIGWAGGAVATFQQNPALTWSFGFFVAPDSDVPVLPAVGLHWLINQHYTLEVGFPKTRLTYRVDPKWSLYTGVDLNGTTFRSGETLGTKTGYPNYNNALATYRDIRLGVGAGYEVGHGLRAEIEAGCSVYRDINYNDIDQDVKFNPAPYVRLGLSIRL
jgi:hypothetical protein